MSQLVNHRAGDYTLRAGDRTHPPSTRQNPLKSALKPIKPSLDDFITEYEAYLTKKRFSPATIRNYLNDIRQFIDWSKSHLVSQNL